MESGILTHGSPRIRCTPSRLRLLSGLVNFKEMLDCKTRPHLFRLPTRDGADISKAFAQVLNYAGLLVSKKCLIAKLDLLLLKTIVNLWVIENAPPTRSSSI